MILFIEWLIADVTETLYPQQASLHEEPRRMSCLLFCCTVRSTPSHNINYVLLCLLYKPVEDRVD